MITVNGECKRNLQEQVEKNKDDIEELDERVTDLEIDTGLTKVLTNAVQDGNKLKITKYDSGVETQIVYEPEITPGGGNVNDVKVNSESVVIDKVANIDLTPYAKEADLQSEITNRGDADTNLSNIITNETTARESGDNNLQTQINSLSGVVTIKVVSELPAEPVVNTMYYVGTNNPYRIYLKTADALIDLGSSSVDLSGYVKTTDDQTIAGNKTFSSAIIASDSQALSRSVDNEAIRINGGTGYRKGARLWLSGKDAPSYNGAFSLEADNGDKVIQLMGKPNGTLTWDGKNITVPSSDGTAGQVLQSNGTGAAPSWVNIAGGTAKYQHNICASDSATVMINFSFINSVPDAYTKNEDVSLALYNLGFTEARKSMSASGTVYSLVYGTASGNFYYWKNNWASGAWGKITDTVVEC